MRQTSPIWTHHNFKSTLNFPPRSPKSPTRVSLKGCVSMTLCVTSGCHADTLLLLLPVRAVLSHFSTSRKVFPPCGKAIILWLAIICWLWCELSRERNNKKTLKIFGLCVLWNVPFSLFTARKGWKLWGGSSFGKSHLGGKLKSYRLDMEIDFFGKSLFPSFFRHFKFEEKSHTVNVPPPPEVSRTHHVLIPPHVVTGKWHNRHHLTHTRTGIPRGG